MGTRHLIAVMYNNEYRIAQYGQWDGYISGQGADILKFLQTVDLDKFKQKLQNVSFLTDEDIENINSTYPNGKWKNVFPYLSRDMGSEILNYVYNLQEDQIKLQNKIEFSKDSLFCEYAYVIDLDNNSFEIYKGFNKTPIDEDQRFYWNNYQDNGYYPVKLHTKFNLTVLPDYDTLLKIDNTEEF